MTRLPRTSRANDPLASRPHAWGRANCHMSPSFLFSLPRVHSACALPCKHPGFAARPLPPHRTPLQKSSPQRALSAGFSVSAPTQLSVAGDNKITNQTCISLYLLDHQPPVGSCHLPQFSRVQHRRTSWESPGPLCPLRLLHAGPAPSPSPPARPTGPACSHGLWTQPPSQGRWSSGRLASPAS